MSKHKCDVCGQKLDDNLYCDFCGNQHEELSYYPYDEEVDGDCGQWSCFPDDEDDEDYDD
jgi:hypothetical protein